MQQPDNTELRDTLRSWLKAEGENALTWVETHGLLTALACAPRLPDGWQDNVLSEGETPTDIAVALENYRQRIAARLVAGEGILLPCRLDPDEDRDGQDLASWCIGFMTGVSLDEALWGDDDDMITRLLPFVLISGFDDDPELDELWNNRPLVRQMAMGIPDLIEELFLHFHAPDSESSDREDHEHEHDDDE